MDTNFILFFKLASLLRLKSCICGHRKLWEHMYVLLHILSKRQPRFFVCLRQLINLKPSKRFN